MPNIMKILRKIKTAIIIFFEFFLFTVFPLWIPNGYTDLAGDKYDAFMFVSLITILAILPINIFIGFFSFKDKSIRLKNLLPILLWLPLFLGISFSTIISDYRAKAYMGSGGWYMGYFTYIVFFFILANTSMRTDWVFRITFCFQFVGSLIVNIIAVLNRFRIYPVPGIENVRYFISTIGNSNWYAGYLCLFLFLNTGIFLIKPAANRIIAGFQVMYMIIGSFCIFTCGNQSVYLFSAVFMLLAVLHHNANSQYYKKLLAVFVCFGIASEAFALTYPSVFLNDDSLSHSFIAKLMFNHLGSAVIVISIVLMYYFKRNDNAHLPDFITRRVANYIIVALCSLPVALLILQLMPVEVFSSSFGNGRGFIWSLSKEAFYSLSAKQKLFGIGPDAVCFYLYDHQYFLDILTAAYGNTILTNCHSIILNDVLNWGIVITVNYLVLYYLTIRKLLKSCDHLSSIIAWLLISVLVFGTITFDHILFTPYVFYSLGVSHAIRKPAGPDVTRIAETQ
jgi:hypothetical protein